MKNYAYVGCSILTDEVCSLARHAESLVDLRFIPAGFHEQPGVMRKIIQEEIDRIEEWNLLKKKSPTTYQTYDAILLGFGLCERSAIGLHAKSLPLVVPKAHDCITILLGSKERYLKYTATNSTTFWYSPGWIERMLPPGPDREMLLAELYSRKYDPSEVEFLLESERMWQKKYQQAVFINWNLPHNNKNRRYVRHCARHLNWNYTELQGDPGLLKDLLAGNWDEERFLVLKPGEEIEASYDDGIMKAANSKEN